MPRADPRGAMESDGRRTVLSLGGSPRYCTRNAGVTVLNWNQPSPSLTANCALFDPYHVASKAVWFSSVVAATQYFTPCCNAGAPLNFATANWHVSGFNGTVAMPETKRFSWSQAAVVRIKA